MQRGLLTLPSFFAVIALTPIAIIWQVFNVIIDLVEFLCVYFNNFVCPCYTFDHQKKILEYIACEIYSVDYKLFSSIIYANVMHTKGCVNIKLPNFGEIVWENSATS